MILFTRHNKFRRKTPSSAIWDKKKKKCRRKGKNCLNSTTRQCCDDCLNDLALQHISDILEYSRCISFFLFALQYISDTVNIALYHWGDCRNFVLLSCISLLYHHPFSKWVLFPHHFCLMQLMMVFYAKACVLFK